MTVDCRFYVRPLMWTAWYWQHPLDLGDLVGLYEKNTQLSGQFRVIERAWQFSSYGSYNWPLMSDESTVPPTLELIVESADGPFRDDAEHDEEGEYLNPVYVWRTEAPEPS